MKLIPFAWDGLSFNIPIDWELSAFAGGRKLGGLHLSDIEFGERMAIRWEESEKPMSLKETLESIKAENEKKGFSFLSSRPFTIKGHKSIMFEVGEGQASDLGAIWYCQDRKRSHAAYVRYDPKAKEEKETAKRVISSASCHEKGNYRTWALLGLKLRVPSEFVYESAAFALGLSHLVLKGKTKHERIFLLKWDFAEEVSPPELELGGFERLLKRLLGLDVILRTREKSVLMGREASKVTGDMFFRDYLLRRKKVSLEACSFCIEERSKHYVLGAMMLDGDPRWRDVERVTLNPTLILI